MYVKKESYESKKEKLLQDFLKFSEEKKGIELKKDTSNLFRNRQSTNNKIDVRHFNEVIQIDPINLIAEIEGMTTYEKIVDETLKFNCLPTVVPELKSITIGGALAGVGIESSSFRYGLVHETLLEFEVLLGDGRIILCTPTNEHRDLFYAFPNTYGTLGYALKVKVKLIPVKPYVKLTYTPFTHPKSYFSWLNKVCLDNRDTHSPIAYIDGVVFNKNELYTCTGEFVDNAPFVSHYQYLNIYYTSIKKKQIDYLTIKDYIWRWDTDWFWCSKHFFMQYKLMRILFGKWLLKSTAYWKIRSFFNRNKMANFLFKVLKGPTETIIQDVETPIENAEEFLDFFQKEIGIKPIWICPIMPFKIDVQYDFYKMDTQKLYINFGFWDIIPSKKLKGFYNRLIEKKIQDLKGNKSLYSNSYYTYDEFWSIYDENDYDRLKAKYDPHNTLQNIYQKCIK